MKCTIFPWVLPGYAPSFPPILYRLEVLAVWQRATMETKDQKKHRKKNSGPKAEKKKKRHLQALQLGDEEDARKRNPKAFAVQSAVRMARSFHRYVQREPNCSSVYSFQAVEASSDDVWIQESVPALKDMELHATFLLLKCGKSFLWNPPCLEYLHTDWPFFAQEKS